MSKATCRWGQGAGRPSEGRAVAALELLAGAAGAGLVAADLRGLTDVGGADVVVIVVAIGAVDVPVIMIVIVIVVALGTVDVGGRLGHPRDASSPPTGRTLGPWV